MTLYTVEVGTLEIVISDLKVKKPTCSECPLKSDSINPGEQEKCCKNVGCKCFNNIFKPTVGVCVTLFLVILRSRGGSNASIISFHCDGLP